jgi:hypothetical protein
MKKQSYCKYSPHTTKEKGGGERKMTAMKTSGDTTSSVQMLKMTHMDKRENHWQLLASDWGV